MLRELTKEEQKFILDRADRLLKSVQDFFAPFYWLDNESTDEVLRERSPFNRYHAYVAGQTKEFVEHLHENIGKLRIEV